MGHVDIFGDDLVAPDEREPGIYVAGGEIEAMLQRYNAAFAVSEELHEQLLGMLEQEIAGARNDREKAGLFYHEDRLVRDRLDEQLAILAELGEILRASGVEVDG
jgi:hypothetical protein